MLARENPFSTDRLLRLRYQPQEMSWEDILLRLARVNYRAAIVGPCGSGKTTLLEDLCPLLAARGFEPLVLRVEAVGKRARILNQDCRKIFKRSIVLLDSAELLSRTAWFLFRLRCRKAAGLIITSHQPGRLPALIRCSTSPELLEELVNKLLPEKEQAGLPHPQEVFLQSEGNLRAALLKYYDFFAACVPARRRAGG